MFDRFTAIDLVGSAADRIQHVNLILNVFEARAIWKAIKKLANFFFGCVHSGNGNAGRESCYSHCHPRSVYSVTNHPRSLNLRMTRSRRPEKNMITDG